MGYICEICQFYDFSEKYFIKNSYSAAIWGALAPIFKSGAKFRTFWHMEGSVAHNLGGFSSLFRTTLTSCMMCRDHISKKMREHGWPENDQNNFPGARKSDAQTDLIANAIGTAYLNYGEPRKRRITILDPENGEKKNGEFSCKCAKDIESGVTI